MAINNGSYPRRHKPPPYFINERHSRIVTTRTTNERPQGGGGKSSATAIPHNPLVDCILMWYYVRTDALFSANLASKRQMNFIKFCNVVRRDTGQINVVNSA